MNYSVFWKTVCYIFNSTNITLDKYNKGGTMRVYSPLGCFKIVYGDHVYHVSNHCDESCEDYTPIPNKLLFIRTPREYVPSEWYEKYVEDVPEQVRECAEQKLVNGLTPWISDVVI